LRRIPILVYVVDMRGSVARRKGDDGPRLWLDDGGDRPDSGALFSQTYLAISDLGADAGRPRHTRRWIALSVLLVAAAIVAGGIAARSRDWPSTVGRPGPSRRIYARSDRRRAGASEGEHPRR
jgi:hypothetical protein